MLLIDSLVTIGLATVSLGTINESDGKQEHDFWLRNVGTEEVSIVQRYTSCGCVTILCPLGETINPGDSVRAVLSFNPKGRGGDFYERGIIVYGPSRKRLDLAIEGVCMTTEETLMKQFPVKINEDIMLSANHFDLGVMKAGETKRRNIVILHRDEGDRKECVSVSIKADESLGKGIHRLKKVIRTRYKNQTKNIEIYFDILVQTEDRK